MAVTYSDLRTRAKTWADMADTDFVSAAEWLEFINESLFELYDILVSKYESYFESTSTQVTVVDQEDYPLPTDFYKLLEVEYKSPTDSTYWATLYPVTSAMRNALRNYQSFYGTNWREHSRYQIAGNSLRLVPAPLTGGRTLRIRYVPTPTRLEDLSDELPLGLMNQWSIFIVLSAAIKAKMKQEDDVQALMFERDRVTKRIDQMSLHRDKHIPKTINPTRGMEWW